MALFSGKMTQARGFSLWRLKGVNNIRGQSFVPSSRRFLSHMLARETPRVTGLAGAHRATPVQSRRITTEKPGEVADQCSEGRAEAEAAHGSAQLGSAQAACKQASAMPQGAKVWRQRRLLSELSASPPPSRSSSRSSSLLLSFSHFQNPTQALWASWAPRRNQDFLTSFQVEGARMSSCHTANCVRAGGPGSGDGIHGNQLVSTLSPHLSAPLLLFNYFSQNRLLLL